jgi:UDPglucose--hexose-1-phosphate uridylyltransferase
VPDPPEAPNDSPVERRARAAGVCEVVVYSAEHAGTLAGLSHAQVRRLIDVWADRYEELSARPEVKYVFIFENRGKEIGVTLTHPHGQIYAFPFVPPRVAREHETAASHAQATGRCLQCDLLAEELSHGRRIVAEAKGFAAYVPFAARVPYELHVVATGHRASLLDLSDAERDGLAAILREVQAIYDGLWDREMPYTMSMHQAVADGVERPGEHLHIEFLPPYRTRDKLKYLAGVETGAGTFINDASPEAMAAELRDAAGRIHR